MPANTPEYSRTYYLKKRKELHTKLGGQCFMCHSRKHLIVHRIYKLPLETDSLKIAQKMFGVEASDQQNLYQTTEKTIEAHKKALYCNTDNMVLLCPICYKYAIAVYGRKTIIGRRQLHKLTVR